jgi:RNA methyltransferase, TrmH family
MITSTHNSRIQRLRALLSRRQVRENEHSFVVEGVRLVEECIKNNWQPQEVYACSSLSSRGRDLLHVIGEQGVSVEETSIEVMESISATETSQGILAVIPLRMLPVPDTLDFILVLDNIRDPGNAGTLLRTAAAAGVQMVMLTTGTADPFSPKVLRAGMGAQFQMPVRQCSWKEIVNTCRPAGKQPLQIILADAGQGALFWQMDLRQPVALITGGEAEGASLEARQVADTFIRIPMPGKCESLNAAMASGIILFEVVRQRMDKYGYPV